MRILAAEKGSGTLELLITMPVKDSEVILGKYLAALRRWCLILLAGDAPLPDRHVRVALAPRVARLGSGVRRATSGASSSAAAAVGVGLMLSSLTESDVIAFFMTPARLASSTRIGWLAVDGHTGTFGDAVELHLASSRATSRSREASSTRAPSSTSLSVTILCLLVSFRSLESRKWS